MATGFTSTVDLFIVLLHSCHACFLITGAISGIGEPFPRDGSDGVLRLISVAAISPNAL